MQCCGQNRTSKFCPDCGGALLAGPLATLLQHVANQTRVLKRRVEHYRSKCETDGSAFFKTRLPAAERGHLKWSRWADELENAIARIKELDDAK